MFWMKNRTGNIIFLNFIIEFLLQSLLFVLFRVKLLVSFVAFEIRPKPKLFVQCVKFQILG